MTRSDRLFHLSVSFLALTLVFCAQALSLSGAAVSASVYGPMPVPKTHASASEAKKTTAQLRREARLKKTIHRPTSTTKKATYLDSHIAL